MSGDNYFRANVYGERAIFLGSNFPLGRLSSRAIVQGAIVWGQFLWGQLSSGQLSGRQLSGGGGSILLEGNYPRVVQNWRLKIH